MIIFSKPEKHPLLSGLAYLGAGVGGTSIYGLVLYEFPVIWGALGAVVGCVLLLGAAYGAERMERKETTDETPS